MTGPAPGTRRGQPLPRLAIAADGAIALLLVVGTLAAFTDGFDLQAGSLHVSIHSAWRPYFWALVLAVVRNWRVPSPPTFVWLVPPSALDWLRRHASAPLALEEADLFPAARPWPRRLGEFALLVGLYSVLVVALTWPQALRMADGLPDRGDPLFSIWRIAWVSHQIFRHPLQLFDANIFYPERLTLTYSDPIILPALFATPLFWAGVHPVVIYNLLLLSAFVFSGVATFYLVRALTGRAGAALVAGTIFAFYPYRYEHYPHLELQMTMWMPLAAWALHRTLARGRLRDGLAVGLAFAAQALSSLYYGLFLALYLMVLGGALWIARGRPRRPLRALAAGGVLAVLLTAPVASAYIANRQMVGDRGTGAVAFYSATGPDFLKPHVRSAWYGRWAAGGHPERQLFPRIAPVVLAAAALWPPLSAARIAYTLALALTVDGSLGLNGAIYPPLYEFVLPFRGLRVPARFSIFTGLTLAILAGFGVARWLRRWPRHAALISAALVAAVAIEAVPNMTFERVWRQPPPIYDVLDRLPEPPVVAEFPMPTSELSYPIDARYLYFSTFHWYRLVNGNSGHFPKSYVELTKREADFPSDQAIQYLKQRGVQYFTVHGAFMDPGRYQSIVTALAKRTDVKLVAAAPWEGSESRLYELER